MVVVSLSTSGIEANWADGGNPVKPPPKGLEPIGDSGWYSSPQDLLPGDRGYCDYNPGSPVCGGNPFTSEGLGIDFEVNVDPCGFSVRVSGSAAFVKTQEIQTTYRKPGECRREYEKEPPTPVPPDISGADYNPPPFSMPDGFGNGETVVCAIAYNIFYVSQEWNPRMGAYGTFTEVYKSSGSNAQNPSTLLYAGKNGEFGTPKKANCSVDFSFSRVGTNDATYIDFYGDKSGSTSGSGIAAIDSRQQLVQKSTGGYWGFKKGGWSSVSEVDAYTVNIFEGAFGDIKSYLGNPNGRTVVLHPGIDPQGRPYESREISITEVTLLFCVRKNVNDYSKNPPSPIEKDKECCMQCCSNTPTDRQQEDNNDLLRQILAECKKANQRIGSDLFPASFPSKLTGSSSSTVTLNNLAEMHKQQVMYLDEVVGEYPVKVKIEDTDATQEGNQSQTLEFGNTSELLAEAFGVLMSLAIDSNTLVQLSTKNLIETGITRKQVHTMQSVLDALIAHTGFERKEEVEDVPFTFTVPNAANTKDMTLSDFCKESTQKVEVMKYTGKTTYEEDRAIIRHAHGILKSVFWRGVAKDAANVGLAIRDIIKKQNDAANKIATGTGEDLDNWAEDFEMGFTSYTGGTTTRDPAKPYGLDLSQRPRVQIIHKPGQLPPST